MAEPAIKFDPARYSVRGPTLLDKWKATSSPSALKQLRRFEAAQNSRLNFGWNASNSKLDSELRGDLVPLRARARDLSINNDYARKFLSMMSANVVGPSGFTLQSQVAQPNGNSDDLARKAIENAFWRWGMAGECETSAKMGFADFCRLYIRTVARDGEVLVRRIRNARFTFGYRLQMLDIDRLDITLNEQLPGGNIVRMGVELDGYGAPAAYWLLTRHPGEYMAQNGALMRERIPANEIFHCFMADRPEQTRGFPWMASAMMSLNMLGGYQEAAVTAARVGASKMGFWTSPDGTAKGLSDGADDQGTFTTHAEPGQFDVVPEGYKFENYNPEYPTQNYDSFVKTCLRSIASGLDVTYNTLANDLEGVSFSSIRSGTLAERENFMVIQNWMIETFLRPMFIDWLESALLKGACTMPNGSALPASKLDKFLVHGFQGRRWQWVDPLKDIEAARLSVQSGISSPQQIAAQNGLDVEDVLESIATFEQLVKDKKVTLVDYSKNTTAPPPAPADTTAETPAQVAAAKAVASNAETMRSIATALTALSSREMPAPVFNFTPAPIEIKQGDTHVTLPEGCINLEATINTPEVRVDVPPAQIVVAHPERAIQTVERDAKTLEITRTTTTYEAR